MPLNHNSVVEVSHGHKGGRLASARENKGSKRAGGRHGSHHKGDGNFTVAKVSMAPPPHRTFTNPPQRLSGGAGRRREGTDASYLLNFHAPERPAPATTSKPYRRKTPLVHFNKDRFLHANFRFVVCEGDYSSYLADADKMIEWDAIREVHVTTDADYNCPICIEPPSAARVTKCGHVFCWPCLQRLFASCGKPYGPCPICTDIVTENVGSLKPALVSRVQPATVGQTICFDLMRLAKGTITPLRVQGDNKAVGGSMTSADSEAVSGLDGDALMSAYGCPLDCHPDASLSKITVARDEGAITGRERAQLIEMLEAAISNGEQDSVHVIQCCLRKLDTEEAANNAVALARAAEESRGEGRHRTPSSAGETAGGGGGGSSSSSSGSKFLTTTTPKKAVRAGVGSGGKLRWWEGGQMFEAGLSDEVEEEDVTGDDEEDPGVCASTEEEEEEEEQEGHSDVEQWAACDEENLDERGKGSTEVSPFGFEGGGCIPPPPSGVPATYFFYQAGDGQRVFLDSLAMRCLVEEHGGYGSLPTSLYATIVVLRKYVQTEETRKRYRQLEHLPLSCEVAQAEVEVAPLVGSRVLKLFGSKLGAREDERRRRAEREEAERARAERDERRRRGGGTPQPVPFDLFEGPDLPFGSTRSACTGGNASSWGAAAASSPPWSMAAAAAAASSPGSRWGARREEVTPLSLGEASFPSLGSAAPSPAASRSSLNAALQQNRAASWGAPSAGVFELDYVGRGEGGEMKGGEGGGGEEVEDAWGAALSVAVSRSVEDGGGGRIVGGKRGGKKASCSTGANC